MSLVIVEGGVKATKKYKKLMTSRIRWDQPIGADDTEATDNTNSNVPEGATGTAAATPAERNKCDLVWDGVIQRANFKHFVFEQCPSDSAARRFLAEHNLSHFWDMAKNYKDPLLS